MNSEVLKEMHEDNCRINIYFKIQLKIADSQKNLILYHTIYDRCYKGNYYVFLLPEISLPLYHPCNPWWPPRKVRQTVVQSSANSLPYI